MRVLSFFVFLLSIFVINPLFSADEGFKSPEDYRPGNVYEPIDISLYPKPNSAKDCVQLCRSLIEGEIKYWEESKTLMVGENPRLRLIVDMLSLKKNLMNFHLYSRILDSKEDSDMYSIYKSYETIIKNLNSFSEILSAVSFPDFFADKQQEFSFLGKIRTDLSEKNRKNLRDNMLFRGILNSSVLGRSKFDVIQGEKGKFQPGVKADSSQYDFSDVEYVSVIFFPMVMQILDITKGILEDDAEKINQRKKRNKKRKIKKLQNSCLKKQIYTKSFSERKEEDSLQAIDLSVSASPSQILNTQVENGDSLTSTSVVQSTIFQEPLYESPSQVIHGEDEYYDLTPWTRYEKKDSGSKEFLSEGASEEKSTYSPIFSLDDENALTARVFLSSEKETAYESVCMTRYIKLIEALGGSVLDKKKCVHFMARSLIDQQWHSVAMHRLHQDDAHIIPRNTRYWKIAKQLLIDVGLSEY